MILTLSKYLTRTLSNAFWVGLVWVGLEQVSGEYSMIKAAAAAGMLDEKKAVLESLLSIRCAGADVILTYFAIPAAQWLCGERS